jgi:hypothetical protein
MLSMTVMMSTTAVAILMVKVTAHIFGKTN